MDCKPKIAASRPRSDCPRIVLFSASGSATARAADRSALSSATLHGLEGHRIKLAAPHGGATVLIFYSTECPISNSYSPTLNRLVESFPAEKVKWVGVCVDPDLSDAEVKAHARDFGLKFPVARDKHGALARKLGAKVTPEAFVIDGDGQVRYHGRIDDQFAARQKRNANPSTNELRDAIDRAVERQGDRGQIVEAVGCPLPEVPPAATTHLHARTWRRSFRRTVRNAIGPARWVRSRWKPTSRRGNARRISPRWSRIERCRRGRHDPHVGLKFRDVRTLSDQDIATLSHGPKPTLPKETRPTCRRRPSSPTTGSSARPTWSSTLGRTSQFPPRGEDIYRCFVVPTGLTEDQYVSAVEYRAGNRRVVHHILAYVDTSGKARERDEAEPGPGYTCFGGPGDPIHGGLGGWAPGNRPSYLPDGIGRSLPGKSDVIIQVHYHPHGKAETDRSKIGIYFSKKPIKQSLHWSVVINPGLVLPPGQSNIEVKAAWEVPVDVIAHNVSPHMHLLGRDMQISVKFPDGQVQDLIRIADWDFNWQYTYQFEKPIDIPKGSLVYLVSHYDNSAANPKNPNQPPMDVKWGEATTDEMCIGFLGVTKKGQDLTGLAKRTTTWTSCGSNRRNSERSTKRMRREAKAKDRKAVCGRRENEAHE